MSDAISAEHHFAPHNADAALCADVRDYIQRVWVSDAIQPLLITGDSKKTHSIMPYGSMSHLLAATPIIVFDDPRLAAKVPTACTDGNVILVNVDFAATIIKDDEARSAPTGGRKFSTGGGPGTFVMLHEIAHIAYGHTLGRLNGSATHEQLNWMFDMLINSRLLEARNLDPGIVAKIGVGFRPDNPYKGLSEEEGLLLLDKQLDEIEKKQPSDDGEAGEINGQGGGGQPGEGEQAGDDNMPPSFSPTSDGHVIDPQKLGQILREIGREDILEQAGLLNADGSIKDAKETSRQSRDRLLSAVNHAVNEAAAAAADGLDAETLKQKGVPGPAMDSYIKWRLGIDLNPKMTWDLEFKKALKSTGKRMGKSDDHPDDIRHVPPASIGRDSSMYIPGYGPNFHARAKLVFIIDTSGSMTQDELKQSLTESVGAAKSAYGAEVDVFVYFADTELREKPLRVSSKTVGSLAASKLKHVSVAGGGGTDVTLPLRQVMELHKRDIAKNDLKAVVYLSDMGFHGPNRAELPAKIPNIIFVATPGNYNEAFDTNTLGWAKQVELDAGVKVRINEREVVTPPPRQASAPAMRH